MLWRIDLDGEFLVVIIASVLVQTLANALLLSAYNYDTQKLELGIVLNLLNSGKYLNNRIKMCFSQTGPALQLMYHYQDL